MREWAWQLYSYEFTNVHENLGPLSFVPSPLFLDRGAFMRPQRPGLRLGRLS